MPSPLLQHQPLVLSTTMQHPGRSPTGLPGSQAGLHPQGYRKYHVPWRKAALKQWDEAANYPKNFRALHFAKEAGQAKQWERKPPYN